MNGFGICGENSLIPSADFLDNVVRFLDFPLESVEEEINPSDCGAGHECLEALPDALLNSASLVDSNAHDEISQIPKIESVSLQPEIIVRDMSSESFSLQNAPSKVEVSSVLQTSSPASVLESSRSSSVGDVKPIISNLVDIQIEKQYPSTFNQYLPIATRSSTSSASEKSEPSDTSESNSKLDDVQSGPTEVSTVGRRKVRKRKRKRLSVLFGTVEPRDNTLPRPVATKTKKFNKNSTQRTTTTETKEVKKNSSQMSTSAAETMEIRKNSLQRPAASRKCTHCEATKTPQWREGPLGPMTLCNACGVRYRTGRLLPEYRPAASPTFVESLHSNSHKKVLEMREKANEQAGLAEEDAAMSPAPEFVPMSSYLFDCIFEEGGSSLSKLTSS